MTVSCEVCGTPENLIVNEYRRDNQGHKFPTYKETTGVTYGELTTGFKGWICKKCMQKHYNKKK